MSDDRQTQESVTTLIRECESVVTGLRYAGWSKYDFGAMFGIHENKAIEAVRHMRPKLARMYRADKLRTILLIIAAAQEQEDQERAERAERAFSADGSAGTSDPD